MDKMDYLLENKNLDLHEKTKKMFTDLSKQTQANTDEDTEKNVDTFKLYEDFMKEKEGILEISNELCEYTLGLDKSPQFTTKNLQSIEDLINFKNRIIMIVIINIYLNKLAGSLSRTTRFT